MMSEALSLVYLGRVRVGVEENHIRRELFPEEK